MYFSNEFVQKSIVGVEQSTADLLIILKTIKNSHDEIVEEFINELIIALESTKNKLRMLHNRLLSTTEQDMI